MKKCKMCGKELTAEDSVVVELGPDCLKKAGYNKKTGKFSNVLIELLEKGTVLSQGISDFLLKSRPAVKIIEIVSDSANTMIKFIKKNKEYTEFVDDDGHSFAKKFAGQVEKAYALLQKDKYSKRVNAKLKKLEKKEGKYAKAEASLLRTETIEGIWNEAINLLGHSSYLSILGAAALISLGGPISVPAILAVMSPQVTGALAIQFCLSRAANELRDIFKKSIKSKKAKSKALKGEVKYLKNNFKEWKGIQANDIKNNENKARKTISKAMEQSKIKYGDNVVNSFVTNNEFLKGTLTTDSFSEMINKQQKETGDLVLKSIDLDTPNEYIEYQEYLAKNPNIGDFEDFFINEKEAQDYLRFIYSNATSKDAAILKNGRLDNMGYLELNNMINLKNKQSLTSATFEKAGAFFSV
jgi:hypothetical protein